MANEIISETPTMELRWTVFKTLQQRWVIERVKESLLVLARSDNPWKIIEKNPELYQKEIWNEPTIKIEEWRDVPTAGK